MRNDCVVKWEEKSILKRKLDCVVISVLPSQGVYGLERKTVSSVCLRKHSLFQTNYTTTNNVTHLEFLVLYNSSAENWELRLLFIISMHNENAPPKNSVGSIIMRMIRQALKWARVRIDRGIKFGEFLVYKPNVSGEGLERGHKMAVTSWTKSGGPSDSHCHTGHYDQNNEECELVCKEHWHKTRI